MDGTYPSIGSKLSHQMFRMVVYLILRCAVREGCNVCIITIDYHPRFLFLQERWQKLSRPEHLRLFARPSVMWIAIEAMDENNIDRCWTSSGGGDFCQAIAVDWDV